MSSTRICSILCALVSVLPFVTSSASAQNGAQVSIANEFRYGIGEQFEQDIAFRKEYLENMLNTRVYIGDFTLGFRAAIDKPRENGRDTIGFSQVFAEFRRDGVRARAGSFYNLIGRGLTMNTFESRPLGFNTQTDGIKLDYENPDISVGGFGGIQNYNDILSSTRTEEYLIRGASGEVRPHKGVGIGGAFVQATGRKTRQGFLLPFDAYMRELHLNANVGAFNAYINFGDKRTQLDSSSRAVTTSAANGYGWLASFGYKSELLGVTAEMKDYRYDIVQPSEIQSSTRSTRALPFQSPPTLLPEYDKTLLSRNPHAIDFSDELGFQVEALIFPTEGLNLTLIGSAASRHNAWKAFRDSLGYIFYNRINESPVTFAKFSDPMYSPFWEFYLQGDYEVSEDVNVTVGIQRRDNIIYDEGNGASDPHIQDYKATTILLETLLGLNTSDKLHAILELQQVYDSKKKSIQNDSLGIKAHDGKYGNALLTLEYSHSPKWSANVRVEFTTTDQEQAGRQLWPVAGITYRIGGAHTFNIQYGAERGGVVCTGGVCRLINPFTGFRISLVSKL